MGLRGVMRVYSASKVTKRIIWTCKPYSIPIRYCKVAEVTNAVAARPDSGGPLRPDSRVLRHFRLQSPYVCEIMGDSAIVETTAFKTAVAQEEVRLNQLHPTPEDTPSCMTVFDDFLSCNSKALPSSLRCFCPRS